MKKLFIGLYSIFFQEGIKNYIVRKRKTRKLKGNKWFTIKYKGKKIKILLREKNGYVDNFIYQNGIYEESLIDSIVEHLGPNSTFVDIGANIGQHSLVVSQFCKKVIAFEPLSFLVEQIQESISANKISNIEIRKLGLGDTKGEKDIYIDPNQSGYSTLLNHLKEVDGFSKNPEVVGNQLISIDLMDNQLLDTEVSVIKMDIEGYEYYAFLGGIKTLRKHKPVVILEFSNMFYENLEKGLSEKFFNLIKELNYKVFSIDRKIELKSIKDVLMNQKQENILLIPSN